MIAAGLIVVLMASAVLAASVDGLGPFAHVYQTPTATSLFATTTPPHPTGTVTASRPSTATPSPSTAISPTPGPPRARIYVTNDTGNSVSVIDTSTATVIKTFSAGGSAPRGLALSPDRSKLYVSNFSCGSPCQGTLTVFDTTSFALLATVPVGNNPAGVAVTPDGSRVYVANWGLPGSGAGTTISVIDTSNYTVIKTIGGLAPGPWYLAMNRSGTRLYVTSHSTYPDGAVTMIDVASNTILKQISLVSPTDLVLTPDGSRLYVVNYNSAGFVSVINTGTFSITSTIALGDYGFDVAMNSLGTQVYVTNSNSGHVTVVNLSSSTVVTTVPVGTYPDGIAISSDDKYAYVANNGGSQDTSSHTVSIIDMANNSVVGTIPVGTQPWAVLSAT
jgi:YVTN family beta-propeller protein